MLKILALFAVASAEVACGADANADTWCKKDDGYIGKCTGTSFQTCTVNDTPCFTKAEGESCGGSGSTFGRCEEAEGKCKNRECPAGQTVVNGTFTCTDSQRVPGSDAACTLVCDAYYKVKTESSYKCDAQGTWEGVRGECEAPPNCADTGHPTVTNGTLHCSNVLAPGADACTLSCPSGIKTATGRKCSAAGEWTGVNGECVPDCANSGHPTVTNGTLTCSAVLAPGSAKCTLTCYTGYRKKTDTGRMCSAAGEWMGVAGECEVDPSSSASSSSTKDNDHSAAISTATAIVVAAFALH